MYTYLWNKVMRTFLKTYFKNFKIKIYNLFIKNSLSVKCMDYDFTSLESIIVMDACIVFPQTAAL